MWEAIQSYSTWAEPSHFLPGTKQQSDGRDYIARFFLYGCVFYAAMPIIFFALCGLFPNPKTTSEYSSMARENIQLIREQIIHKFTICFYGLAQDHVYSEQMTQVHFQCWAQRIEMQHFGHM